RKHDPHGERTMCVITKPDRAEIVANTLPEFVKYAKNAVPGYKFKLGWHIVRNPGPEDTTENGVDRDDAEKLFFDQADWAKSLNSTQLGIDKLRERLSTILEHHMRTTLSGVIDDIKSNLATSKIALQKLGSPRSTIEAQRLYLTTASERFQQLVQQA